MAKFTRDSADIPLAGLADHNPLDMRQAALEILTNRKASSSQWRAAESRVLANESDS